MTLILSLPEARSQSPQTEPAWSLRQPWTIPLIDASGKSQGYRQRVHLRQGLDVLIDDYTLQDDLVVDLSKDEPREPYLRLEMSFMLSGHNCLEGVQPCQNFLVADWVDWHNSQFLWQANERILKFDIHIEPDLFETLVGEQLGVLPPLLKQLIQNSQPIQEQFWHMQPTTAAMQSVIHQILHCPYQGLTRWLYLESKVIAKCQN